MAYKFSSRGGAPRLWVTVHTAEGSRTAASLGAYFYDPGTQASSHVGIDANNTLQYVSYANAAWTLRNGNEESDNAEICGFANWTRNEWLSTSTVDGCANPRAMVRRAALWAKARCLVTGIPIRHLTPTQVGAGMKGIIGHWDYTRGTGDGTHTDPGANFPWDIFFNDMEDDDMPLTDADVQKIWGYKNPALEATDAYAILRYGARPWEQPLSDGTWNPGGDQTATHAVAYIHQIQRRNEDLAAQVDSLSAKVDQILLFLQNGGT